MAAARTGSNIVKGGLYSIAPDQAFSAEPDTTQLARLRTALKSGNFYRGHGAIPISVGGPVRLPAPAGGVTAVNFRDPEGPPARIATILNAWNNHGELSVPATKSFSVLQFAPLSFSPFPQINEPAE